jgi:hypothetical protein
MQLPGAIPLTPRAHHRSSGAAATATAAAAAAATRVAPLADSHGNHLAVPQVVASTGNLDAPKKKLSPFAQEMEFKFGRPESLAFRRCPVNGEQLFCHFFGHLVYDISFQVARAPDALFQERHFLARCARPAAEAVLQWHSRRSSHGQRGTRTQG